MAGAVRASDKITAVRDLFNTLGTQQGKIGRRIAGLLRGARGLKLFSNVRVLGEVAARRGAFVPYETNGLTCPTEANRGIENIGEYRRLSNPESVFANENPGALAGATGAKQIDRVIKAKDYIRDRQTATALCHAILDCDPADACEVMAVAYGDLRAGMPIAPLEGLMSEARIWAEFATRDELKAYCAATFAAMPARDQAAFLDYAQGRAAA